MNIRDKKYYLNQFSIGLVKLDCWLSFKLGRNNKKHLEDVAQGFNPFRILRFERIVSPETLIYPIAASRFVRPETFRMQMSFISKNFNVISLSELIKLIVTNQVIPPRTVVVTFDYGYTDFINNAYPILKEFNVPATLFLPVDCIGTNDASWIDFVVSTIVGLAGMESPILHNQKIRSYISDSLIGDKIPKEQSMEVASILIEEYSLATKQEKRELTDALNEIVEDKKIFIERQFMDWGEISKINQEGGVEFGICGLSCDPMLDLKEGELLKDIVSTTKRTKLHDLKLVSAFSFPEGYFEERYLNELSAVSVQVALGWGDAFMPPISFNGVTKMLGRVLVMEGLANTDYMFENLILI